MEPEGKQGTTLRAMAAGAGEERLAECGGAEGGVEAGVIGEFAREAAVAVDGAGGAAHELGFDVAEAEAAFDPAREEVGAAGVPIAGVGLRADDAQSQRAGGVRVAEVALGGDAAQGLADDPLGADLVAEEERCDLGDLDLAIGEVAFGRNTEFRKAAARTLPVLDDRGSRFLLVSNQVDPAADEVDQNPITRALITELPPGATKVSINFEDKIELIGWQLDPAEPSPGSPLVISLFWKALVDDPGTWKVFVHIDAAGQRIHGDHDPVEGLFPTRNWRKGDLVRDDHRVVVKRTISPARFTFYAGLYRGGTRMKITVGAKDNEDRARLGTIEVR